MTKHFTILLFIRLVWGQEDKAQSPNINTHQDSKVEYTQNVNLYQLGQIIKKTKLKKNPKRLSNTLPITMNVGDTVKVIDDKNKKYVKIEINEQLGWVSKKHFEYVSSIMIRIAQRSH